jgi:hypothetical protein
MAGGPFGMFLGDKPFEPLGKLAVAVLATVRSRRGQV